MDLDRYYKRRDFNSTTEPKGDAKKSNGELIFVIQKHNATHLHYDFRLEMDGVLKSWVIPKGPSMNPEQRRLAILVEDHPYSYKDFEGVIPEGNYGAGTVIVWDTGTYTLEEESNGSFEKNIKADIQNGYLSFILNGKKLKGGFTLVRLKIKQKNAWLLIKKDDQYASETDVLEKDKSVISGKILEAFDK